MRLRSDKLKLLLFSIYILGLGLSSAAAQTTAFTYQGKLNDAALSGATNGYYDFLFRLYDAGGAQLPGAQRTATNVAVINGIFTVELDFGNLLTAPASDLFLDISVRRSPPPNTPPGLYQTLAPRQKLASVPLALRALNASLFGGLPLTEFIQAGDARLTDDRSPLAGSANYIQNQNAAAQAGNFNLSGGGTLGGTLSANAVSAATNFKIGNQIILSTPNQTSVVAGALANHSIVSANSAFFGYRAGFSSNSFSFSNTFIGSQAGQATTVGWHNTFVGNNAGLNNTSGTHNSYFGSSAGAGAANGAASYNSIFGYEAGATISGSRNSFFGYQAGKQIQTGVDNAFFGYQAGALTIGNNFYDGNNNAFFGSGAGSSNTSGSDNVFIGKDAGAGNMAGNFNTFVGRGAGGASDAGIQNTIVGYHAGGFTNGMIKNTIVGYQAGNSSTHSGNTYIGANANSTTSATHSTAIGADAYVDSSNTIVLGTSIDDVKIPGPTLYANTIQGGTMNVGTINSGNVNANFYDGHFAGVYLGGHTGPGTGNELCRDNNNKIVVCSSSSLRYKTNVLDYTGGLNVLFGLRPIAFDWKTDGTPDIGFAAEEVEKADPRLVFFKDGQVEGVKYNRISLVLVNSIKEQQKQIEAQRRQIDELKAVVCSIKPDATVCWGK